LRGERDQDSQIRVPGASPVAGIRAERAIVTNAAQLHAAPDADPPVGTLAGAILLGVRVRAGELGTVRRRMRLLLDILCIWLPACLAIVSLVWMARLSRLARGSWRVVVHVFLGLIVVYLSCWSLCALYGIRFLDWWPTYLPYIFVAAGLAVSGAWHAVLRRVVV